LPMSFRGRSMVTLTPDNYYEMHRRNLTFGGRLTLRIFGTWAARHATRIIAVSKASTGELAKLFKIEASRIAVIPNGVDSPASTPASNPESSNGYLLYVGQAFPRRHLKETILAFERIVSEFPHLKLVAVGKDKYKPPIIAKLAQDVNERLKREAIVRHDYVPEDELWSQYEEARALTSVSENR